jgi:TonB-dependent receptor
MVQRQLRGFVVLLGLAVAQGMAVAADAARPPQAEDEVLAEVVVTARLSETATRFGEKRATEAFSEIVSGAALERSTLQSASDLIKDVSGVSVSKGANGSSSVSVRGIDQRMLRITVDGQRQGGTGNPLDSIPPEIVQSLEVTKTFTPDMEADAVGGVININTGGIVIPKAYVQGRHQLVANTLAPRPGSRNSLTVAQPFMLRAAEAPDASVLATVSFDDLYARRERFSTLREWTPLVSPGPGSSAGSLVPTLTLPLIEGTLEHRQRSGLLLNADARLDDLVLFLRSNFSRDRAHRQRRFVDTNPAQGTVQQLTPDAGAFSGVALSRRAQDQTTVRDAQNLSLGLKLTQGTRDIDATFAFGATQDGEPQTRETGFLSDRTYRVAYDLTGSPRLPRFTTTDEVDPSDLQGAGAPGRYHLDFLTLTQVSVRDEDGSFKLNLRINREDGAAYVKVGGKLQRRRRTADTTRDVYDAGTQALALSQVLAQQVLVLDTLGYAIGPVPDVGAVAALQRPGSALFAPNVTQSLINSGSGDTSVTEDLWALYAMGKWIHRPWTLLGGVRVEGTHVSARGRQMQFDSTGSFAGFSDAAAASDYLEVLPGLHLRFEPRAGLLYRASITRSMSRPAGADLAPYRTLSFVDHRSRIGTPALKPYLSTNFDLSLDAYDEDYGLLSAAVFFKKIDHFITDAQSPVNVGSLGQFIEFRRINGEAARSLGGELSWQGPSWSLPRESGRANAEASYNFNHGEAHHPTRPGETFPLPRQVDHQANLRLHGTHDALTVDLGVSYRSGWWEDMIAPGLDNYIAGAWDAELSGAYRLHGDLRITAGVSNMLNRPSWHYAGIPTRLNDWQRSGIDVNVGLQWKR